jgi:hypothetical protein
MSQHPRKRRTRTIIAVISLVFYILCLLVSVISFCAPGDYWPFYAIMAVFSWPPIRSGNRDLRIIGIAALMIALLLIGGDVYRGKYS